MANVGFVFPHEICPFTCDVVAAIAAKAMADGKTMVFRPTSPDPHEILQELSDRIRALPDKLAEAEAIGGLLSVQSNDIGCAAAQWSERTASWAGLNIDR